MYLLDVETTFAASHQLRGYDGKCARLHGHNWRIRLTVAGVKLNETGMLVDFVVLKRALEEAIEPFDHRHLNDVPPFDTRNPTSENMACHLAKTVAAMLPSGVVVETLAVWENDKCCAAFRP